MSSKGEKDKMELTKDKIREIIAKRVAKELKDGDVVNLGIGLPTEVSSYIPENVHILLESENGIIGMGGAPKDLSQWDGTVTNAGGGPATLLEGGAIFDSFTSFSLIRGGHVDATVLGALQVDAKGNLANWMVPGKLVPGMGGAMDLVAGAKKVIIAMEHVSKGEIKILEECTLPLTAAEEVDMIVTELGVMKVTPEGLLLTELASYCTLEKIQELTGAKLIISKELKVMEQ